MPKKAAEHIRLETTTKVIVATGLGGAGREYPDYLAKFGKENVTIVCWDKSCSNLDSHVEKLKTNIPKKEPFIGIGHSMGGSIWLELMNRESFPNQQGLVLVGSSRKMSGNKELDFIMKFPWWCIWLMIIGLFSIFPIMLFIWRKKTFDTYNELWRFITKDGVRKIQRQYNQTLKNLGKITNIQNSDIPLVVVRLKKDTLIDEKDLKTTIKMFNNVREQIIETDSLHLTEKFDPITVERIALEAEFLGLVEKRKIEKIIAVIS